MSAIAIPDRPYEIFEPSDQQKFDGRLVSHLMRRAALGASIETLDSFKGKSPKEALEWLFDFDPADDPIKGRLDGLEGFFALDKPEQVQEWWFFRMLNTTHPLQEKVALMWHNQFATSLSKVNDPTLMNVQIDLFRRAGLGSFRDLVIAVGRDPAMLIWLDGRTSVKGKPNENYGRELMELFTLGVGNYTEQDVKEMSRSFTGWVIKGTEGQFAKARFDDGEKELFGKKAKFDSESAVDAILAHPVAPKYLSRRLLKEFVHPTPTDDQIDHYAQRLLDAKWDIKIVLREILSSRLFFSDWAYRAKIKSPVELAVGAVNALSGKAYTQFLREQTAKMGQNLLYPPTVKGWDGQESWINSNTLLLRFNFGLSLATQVGRVFFKKADVETFLARNNIKTADDIVAHYARLFLDGSLTDQAKSKLVDFMNTDDAGKPKTFALTADTLNLKVRGVMHLMMAMPEFQLS